MEDLESQGRNFLGRESNFSGLGKGNSSYQRKNNFENHINLKSEKRFECFTLFEAISKS